MEKELKPDGKYYTKCIWVMLTVTAVLAAPTAIAHLLIRGAGGGPEAPVILWIVVGAVMAFLWAVVFPLVLLWVKSLEYLIYSDRITIHKGFLTKSQQNIPFRAVTDFVLKRTIYDRLLGIGSIQIQTAGQAQTATGYEGSLTGILEYEALQEELRSRVKNLSPVSEALATAEAPAGMANVQSGMAKGSAGSSDELLARILDEVREIKNSLVKKG